MRVEKGGGRRLEIGLKKVEGVNEKIANTLNLFAVDLGFEPGAVGSGAK